MHHHEPTPAVDVDDILIEIADDVIEEIREARARRRALNLLLGIAIVAVVVVVVRTVLGRGSPGGGSEVAPTDAPSDDPVSAAGPASTGGGTPGGNGAASPDDLLDTDAVAAELGVAVDRVPVMAEQGLLTAVEERGSVRYRRAEVDAVRVQGG